MIAGIVCLLLIIGLFSWMIYASSENRKNIKPCTEYSHLHGSMRPYRCWKEVQ